MPATYPELYFPILLQGVIAVAVAAGMILGAYLIGRRVRTPLKEMPYECGMTPVGSARERFSVHFYLVAMVFLLFDVEVAFLFPWVVVFRELGWYGFLVMFLFVDLVLWGFYYIWKKGVLDWAPARKAAVERAQLVRDAA